MDVALIPKMHAQPSLQTMTFLCDSTVCYTSVHCNMYGRGQHSPARHLPSASVLVSSMSVVSVRLSELHPSGQPFCAGQVNVAGV